MAFRMLMILVVYSSVPRKMDVLQAGIVTTGVGEEARSAVLLEDVS